MSFFAKWGTCNDVDHLPCVQLFCNALIFYILIISEIKKLLAWTAPSVGHWPGSRQDYCGLHMHKFGYFPWWLDFWWRYECSSIKICRMSKKVLATWKKSRILILMEHLKKKKKKETLSHWCFCWNKRWHMWKNRHQCLWVDIWFTVDRQKMWSCFRTAWVILVISSCSYVHKSDTWLCIPT